MPSELGLRSIAYVAKYLGVSERTVRRYIDDGKLKTYRLGDSPAASVRIDLADVYAFVGGDDGR